VAFSSFLEERLAHVVLLLELVPAACSASLLGSQPSLALVLVLVPVLGPALASVLVLVLVPPLVSLALLGRFEQLVEAGLAHSELVAVEALVAALLSTPLALETFARN